MQRAPPAFLFISFLVFLCPSLSRSIGLYEVGCNGRGRPSNLQNGFPEDRTCRISYSLGQLDMFTREPTATKVEVYDLSTGNLQACFEATGESLRMGFILSNPQAPEFFAVCFDQPLSTFVGRAEYPRDDWSTFLMSSDQSASKAGQLFHGFAHGHFHIMMLRDPGASPGGGSVELNGGSTTIQLLQSGGSNQQYNYNPTRGVETWYISGVGDCTIKVTCIRNCLVQTLSVGALTSQGWNVSPGSLKPGEEGSEFGTHMLMWGNDRITVVGLHDDTDVELVDLFPGSTVAGVNNPTDDSRSFKLTSTQIWSNTGLSKLAQSSSPYTQHPNSASSFTGQYLEIKSTKPVLVLVGSGSAYTFDFIRSNPTGTEKFEAFVWARQLGFRLLSFFEDNVLEAEAVFGSTYRSFIVGTNSNPWQGVGAYYWSPPVTSFSGELYHLVATKPFIVFYGDFYYVQNGCCSGAYLPDLFNTLTLAPVAVANPDVQGCARTPIVMNGSASFDQDGEGDLPMIRSYKWTSLSTNQLISSAPVTSVAPDVVGVHYYQLNVTDNDNEWDTAEVRVHVLDCCSAYTPPGQPGTDTIEVAIASVEAVSCNGGSDGKISVTATGGISVLSFHWDQWDGTSWKEVSGNSASISGVSAGRYKATASDTNYCEGQVEIQVQEPPQLVATVDSVMQPSCFEMADGSITTSVSGGTSPYSIRWDKNIEDSWVEIEGEIDMHLTDQSQGDFQLTVSDSNGCSTNVEISLIHPPSLHLTATVTQHVLCFGSHDGTVSFEAMGGSPPYEVATLVTSEENNLVQGHSEASSLEELLTGSGFSTNGEGGGLGSGGQGVMLGGKWALADVQDPGFSMAEIYSGHYNGIVFDSQGCYAATAFEITEPPPLIVSIPEQLVSNLTCSGDFSGGATVSIEGGVPLQSSGAFEVTWTGELQGDVAYDAALINAAADTYTATVTDANKCQANASIAITQPMPLEIEVEVSHATCYEANNGKIKVLTLGGTPPYHYEWWRREGTDHRFHIPSASSTIFNLQAGEYGVNVTDSNGCFVQETVPITEPSPLVASITEAVDPLWYGAHNGKIQVSIEGGVDPSTPILVSDEYNALPSWNSVTTNYSSVEALMMWLLGLGNFSFSDTDFLRGNAALFHPTGSEQQFSLGNVPSGHFKVFIMDNHNCTSSSGLQLTQPPPLQLAPATDTALPRWIEMTASVSNMSVGPCGVLSICDAKESNLSEASLLMEGWPCHLPDSYSELSSAASLLNEDFCTQSITTSGTWSALLPPVQCFSGASDIWLNVSGGAPPYVTDYRYLGRHQQALEPEIEFVSDDRAILYGLRAGVHELLLTDSKGGNISRSIVLPEPERLRMENPVVQPCRCAGSQDGVISFELRGGISPFVVSWRPSNFSRGCEEGDMSTTARGAVILEGLRSCTYEVIVVDYHGCEASAEYVVEEPLPLAIEVVEMRQSTGGPRADGSFLLQWSGGVAPRNVSVVPSEPAFGPVPVEILWDILTFWNSSLEYRIPFQPGALTSSIVHKYSIDLTNEDRVQSGTIDNLSSTMYNIVVNDAVGCSAQMSAEITAVPPVGFRREVVENGGEVIVAPDGCVAFQMSEWSAWSYCGWGCGSHIQGTNTASDYHPLSHWNYAQLVISMAETPNISLSEAQWGWYSGIGTYLQRATLDCDAISTCSSTPLDGIRSGANALQWRLRYPLVIAANPSGSTIITLPNGTQVEVDRWLGSGSRRLTKDPSTTGPDYFLSSSGSVIHSPLNISCWPPPEIEWKDCNNKAMRGSARSFTSNDAFFATVGKLERDVEEPVSPGFGVVLGLAIMTTMVIAVFSSHMAVICLTSRMVGRAIARQVRSASTSQKGKGISISVTLWALALGTGIGGSNIIDFVFHNIFIWSISSMSLCHMPVFYKQFVAAFAIPSFGVPLPLGATAPTSSRILDDPLAESTAYWNMPQSSSFLLTGLVCLAFIWLVCLGLELAIVAAAKIPRQGMWFCPPRGEGNLRGVSEPQLRLLSIAAAFRGFALRASWLFVYLPLTTLFSVTGASSNNGTWVAVSIVALALPLVAIVGSMAYVASLWCWKPAGSQRTTSSYNPGKQASFTFTNALYGRDKLHKSDSMGLPAGKVRKITRKSAHEVDRTLPPLWLLASGGLSAGSSPRCMMCPLLLRTLPLLLTGTIVGLLRHPRMEDADVYRVIGAVCVYTLVLLFLVSVRPFSTRSHLLFETFIALSSAASSSVLLPFTSAIGPSTSRSTRNLLGFVGIALHSITLLSFAVLPLISFCKKGRKLGLGKASPSALPATLWGALNNAVTQQGRRIALSSSRKHDITSVLPVSNKNPMFRQPRGKAHSQSSSADQTSLEQSVAEKANATIGTRRSQRRNSSRRRSSVKPTRRRSTIKQINPLSAALFTARTAASHADFSTKPSEVLDPAGASEPVASLGRQRALMMRNEEVRQPESAEEVSCGNPNSTGKTMNHQWRLIRQKAGKRKKSLKLTGATAVIRAIQLFEHNIKNEYVQDGEDETEIKVVKELPVGKRLHALQHSLGAWAADSAEEFTSEREERLASFLKRYIQFKSSSHNV